MEEGRTEISLTTRSLICSGLEDMSRAVNNPFQMRMTNSASGMMACRLIDSR